MKKRLLAFVTAVFTLICMALPAFAEEGTATPPSPRRLDVQLIQIVYENEQYDYVNTTEEDGIRTHIYKKHVNEELPNNNTTTPTDSNTTTENKVVSDHIVPTGDNMMATLKYFAVSLVGLVFVMLKKKGLRDEQTN